MLTPELTQIRSRAFYLKQVMEKNYVPLLKSSLDYVSKIYNYLSSIASTDQKVDSNKAKVFCSKTARDFASMEYNLKQLGLVRAA